MTTLYVNYDPDHDKLSQAAFAVYYKICYVASRESSSSNDNLTSKKEASSNREPSLPMD